MLRKCFLTATWRSKNLSLFLIMIGFIGGFDAWELNLMLTQNNEEDIKNEKRNRKKFIRKQEYFPLLLVLFLLVQWEYYDFKKYLRCPHSSSDSKFTDLYRIQWQSFKKSKPGKRNPNHGEGAWKFLKSNSLNQKSRAVSFDMVTGEYQKST